MLDKNASVLYPLSETDAYGVDMFCTAETFGCVFIEYTQPIFWLPQPIHDQYASRCCTNLSSFRQRWCKNIPTAIFTPDVNVAIAFSVSCKQMELTDSPHH